MWGWCAPPSASSGPCNSVPGSVTRRRPSPGGVPAREHAVRHHQGHPGPVPADHGLSGRGQLQHPAAPVPGVERGRLHGDHRRSRSTCSRSSAPSRFTPAGSHARDAGPQPWSWSSRAQRARRRTSSPVRRSAARSSMAEWSCSTCSPSGSQRRSANRIARRTLRHPPRRGCPRSRRNPPRCSRSAQPSVFPG